MVDVSNVNVNPEDASMGEFSALPAGTYRAVMTASEKKTTSKGTGDYLSFKFTVQQGEKAGSNLFDNLNLWNQSQQASKIAENRYEAICQALGTTSRQVTSTESLHNIPVDLVVDIEEYKTQSGETRQQNRIKKYIQVGYANSSQPAQSPQNPQQPQNQPSQGQQQGQPSTPPYAPRPQQ